MSPASDFWFLVLAVEACNCTAETPESQEKLMQYLLEQNLLRTPRLCGEYPFTAIQKTSIFISPLADQI